MQGALGVSWQRLLHRSRRRLRDGRTDSAPARAPSSFHSGTLRILEQRCSAQKRSTRRPRGSSASSRAKTGAKIIENISGFYSILQEWEGRERPAECGLSGHTMATPIIEDSACSDPRSGIDFWVQKARRATVLHRCYDAARDRGDPRPAYLPGRATIVGSQDDVLELAEFLGNEGVVGRWGFIPEDVERRARDGAILQGADERGLIHDAATRGIDEIGRGFHEPKFADADQLVRSRVVIAFDADEVAVPEQLVKAGGPFKPLFPLLLRRQPGALRIEYLHLEGAQPRNHMLRDLAEPDQPDGLAGAPDPHQRQGLFLLEMSGTRIAVGLDQPIGQAEAPTDRGTDPITREIGWIRRHHRQFAGGSGGEVDMKPDPRNRGDASQCGVGVDHSGRDDIVACQEEPIVALRVRDQLVFRDLPVEVGIDRHLRLPTQNFKRQIGNRLSHKDLILHKLHLNRRFNLRRDTGSWTGPARARSYERKGGIASSHRECRCSAQSVAGLSVF